MCFDFVVSAIAGSEDVPDALQKCHSLSKDLQKNQTILFTHLTEVRADVKNFTIQVFELIRLFILIHIYFYL